MDKKFLAQITNPVLPNQIGGQTGGANAYTTGGSALGGLISSIVGALFIAAFLLAFFYLIQGGITWITASGDKTKLEKARDEITNAMVGIVIVGAAYALSTLVAKFFGLDIANLPIPSVIK